MDTKNSGSNTNIVETDKAGGTDVKTIDMSGTNIPDATNAKTPEERAQDVRIVDGVTRDTSVPTGNVTGRANPSVTQATNAPKLPTVKVRLLGNHTHEGVDYEHGEIIEVDEKSAEYITETVKTGVKV